MKLLLLFSFLILVSMACSQRHEPETHREVVHAVKPGLTLNHGEKWQADEVTNQNIHTMQQLVQLHLKQPDINSAEANLMLGKALQQELENVFATCTMDGPAHDMLHTYLVPLIEDVKQLETVELAEATDARDRIVAQLRLYNTYFK